MRQHGCVFSAPVFVCIFILGINRKSKKHVKYPNALSTTKPMPCGTGQYHMALVFLFLTGDISEMEFSSSTDSEASEKDTLNAEQSTNEPKHLTQLELNDLTLDLNHTKESAQLFGSRLRENNLLTPSTTYFWYRKRDVEFRKYFSYDKDHSLVYCQDILGLILALGIVYIPPERQLFLDSSVKSFKAILLHNGNKVSSVPVGHSVKLTEKYVVIKK